ncbi:MAG TPA: CbiX/SirB N-terminal domain-containing protein [Terriglobia bacterium]|nr:CbiX/SirB N-terminal domain-containing protein [Terriglobia bacterium]
MSETETHLIIFAHGSKVPEANATIGRLASEVSREAGLPATAAFLDVASPDLQTAVAAAVHAGARRILIVPCFLVFGVHVREDLPRLVQQLEREHPGVEMLVSSPLDGHPGLPQLLASRVREALSEAVAGIRGRETG